MSTPAQCPAVSRGALWFGLLGGAVAWLAHLLCAYGIAEFGCVGRLGTQTFLEVTVIAWLLLVLTLLTALAAAAAAFVAYRSGRGLEAGDGHDPRLYMARAGLYASGLFAFGILIESLPIWYYLRHC